MSVHYSDKPRFAEKFAHSFVVSHSTTKFQALSCESQAIGQCVVPDRNLASAVLIRREILSNSEVKVCRTISRPKPLVRCDSFHRGQRMSSVAFTADRGHGVQTDPVEFGSLAWVAATADRAIMPATGAQEVLICVSISVRNIECVRVCRRCAGQYRSR